MSKAFSAAHPDDAERVQSWRAMAEALHARYDGVANEPVPERLELDRLVRQPRKWIYGAVAAGFAAFVAGGAVGWVAHGAAIAPSLVQNFTVMRSTHTGSMWWKCGIRSRCPATRRRICSNG